MESQHHSTNLWQDALSIMMIQEVQQVLEEIDDAEHIPQQADFTVQGIFSGYVRLFNINIQTLGNSGEFWEIRAGGHKQITQKIFSGHKVHVYVIFGY